MGVIFSFVILTVGCAASDYWPTDEWRTSTPEEQGMDSKVLMGILDYISENDLNIHSVTIIRHGYLVFDAYFWPIEPDDLHDIASCTKSITSTLVGIALDKGYIQSLNDPFIKYYSDYDMSTRDADPEPITIRHLLTMIAGLECVNQPTEVTLLGMQRSPDFIQYALDLPMTHPPGTHFLYNSCGSHLLGGIVANSSGMSLERFARVNLFDPIGIDWVYWPHDPQGYNHGWGNLRMKPHDMARLGYLMLNKGRWQGQQIVSRRYVRQTTRNHTKDFGPENGYGFQWWTYKFGSFYAMGRGGQRIFVAPILDLLVVTTAGTDVDEGAHYEAMLGQFVVPTIKRRQAPIDPNPEAFAELQARIAELTRPPAPQPVPELPSIASEISGKTWTLDDNLIGWETVAFSFTPGSPEAELELAVDDTVYSLRVGMDGVPRINSDVSFAADPRYNNQKVVLHGWWERQEVFVLYFNTLNLIDNGTIKFNFDEDMLTLTLFERSFMPIDQVFTGALRK